MNGPTTNDVPPAHGQTSHAAFCASCGAQLGVGARFCHRCGTPVGGSVPAPARQRADASQVVPWAVAALALIALIVLLAGQLVGRPGSTNETPLAGASGGAMRAPDISSMTPEERAERLFDRVMRYSAQGQTDSATFFVPMALAAFEAIEPMTAHHRYDMGLVALAGHEMPVAVAQADTILRESPTHLLGLVLAAQAAEARGDSAAMRAFQRRLLAAEPAERAKALPEYTDHAADLQRALAAARKGS